MKQVGLLGGTFNPPHIGHLIMANEVKHALHLDEVRLMPTSIPPHKSDPSDATPEQRLQWSSLPYWNPRIDCVFVLKLSVAASPIRLIR